MVPLKLAPLRPVRLGQLSEKRFLEVHTVDDDGRPIPGVTLQINVENGRPETTWTYDVGIDGIAIINISDLTRDEVLLLGPLLPLDMASTPPFQKIDFMEEIPEKVTFKIAPRRPERDWLAPVITFALGGIVVTLANYLLGKLK